MNQTQLYKSFKSTYSSSFVHLTQHSFYFVLFLFTLFYFKNSILSIFTIPIMSLMNVRTFTIFHDCGHQSFSPSPFINFCIGSIMGIWVMTPVSWSYDHYMHHLTNGNIENKYNFNFNLTVFYTKQQFDEFTKFQKIIYIFFRYPFTFFLILPPIKFFILNRFDYFLYKFFNKYQYSKSLSCFFLSTLINNVGLFYLCKYLYFIEILPHYLASMGLASIFGTILFHNQHTYNPAYVVGNDTWTLINSGLDGSSFIILPSFLKFFTNGIEYHHIHHMNPRIPGYHLAKYHEYIIKHDPTLFDDVNYLSTMDCLSNCWLVLYDTQEKNYVPFYH